MGSNTSKMTSRVKPLAWDQLCAACHTSVEALSQRLDRFSRKETSNGHIFTPHLFYHDLMTSQATCYLCAEIVSLGIEDKKSLSKVYIFWDIVINPSIEEWTDYGQINRGIIPQGGILLQAYHSFNGLGASRRLEFTSITEEQLESISTRRRETVNSRSPNTLDQIRQWRSECLSNHKWCNDKNIVIPDPLIAPARLLEIGIDGQSLRIRHHSDLSVPPDFVTLSHCWGISPCKFRLYRANLVKFCKSLPIRSLPKTFKDAVEITWHLGYRYIWIDALCIIQDSQEDWLTESCKMADIYARGALNLSAAASLNGTMGLYYSQPATSQDVIELRVEGKLHHIMRIPSNDPFKDEVNDGPLNSRAWTLQERMLSPRTVHFGARHVFWECYTHHVSDVFPTGKNEHTHRFKQWINDPYVTASMWHSVVAAYARRSLTKPEDKLIAIAGVARIVAAKLGVDGYTYLAGLWRHSLKDDLLWFSSEGKGRSCQGRAPSWSWAKMDGPVLYRYTQKHYSVIHEATTNTAGDRFGAVVGGRIWLQGPMFVLDFKKEEFRFTGIAGSTRDSIILPCPPGIIYWDDSSSEDEYQTQGQVFAFVAASCKTSEEWALEEWTFLILRATGVKRGEYRRVGLAPVWPLMPSGSRFQEGVGNTLKSVLYANSLPDDAHQGFEEKIGFTIELV